MYLEGKSIPQIQKTMNLTSRINLYFINFALTGIKKIKTSKLNKTTKIDLTKEKK